MSRARGLAALLLLVGCGTSTVGTGTGSTRGDASGATGGSSGSGSTTTGTTAAGSTSGSGGSAGTAGSGGSTGGTSGTSLCGTQSCLVYAETAHDLYQLDPSNPSAGATELCSFSGDIGSESINDIAVDASGDVYALSSTSLYRVVLPPVSGKCGSTRVTAVQGSSNYNALSFTIDGALLAAGSDGTIASIDLVHGTSSVVGSFASGYGSSGDFVALSDGRIFATASHGSGDDVLVQIGADVSGTYSQQSVIGSVGFANVYGLGFWAGTLYGFDSAGEVLQIDPATGQGTLLGNNHQTWYGAGTTPRAPIFQ